MNLSLLFKPGQLLRHDYGGFYRFKTTRTQEDGTPMAVYEHVWPFEPSEKEKPVSEFLERFKPIEEIVLQDSQRQSAEVVQQAILRRKQQFKP